MLKLALLASQLQRPFQLWLNPSQRQLFSIGIFVLSGLKHGIMQMESNFLCIDNNMIDNGLMLVLVFCLIFEEL